jgi:hypothetical protein
LQEEEKKRKKMKNYTGGVISNCCYWGIFKLVLIEYICFFSYTLSLPARHGVRVALPVKIPVTPVKAGCGKPLKIMGSGFRLDDINL